MISSSAEGRDYRRSFVCLAQVPVPVAAACASSCHNKQTTASIPISLSLRIARICIDPANSEKKVLDLKQRLLDRDYPEALIDSSIYKARKVPRKAALRKVNKSEKKQGPVFVTKFYPRHPSLGNMQARHWRTMTSRDTHLKEVFKRPPLIAYKRQQNIRGLLIRAQVARASKPYPSRQQQGMKRCGKNCLACPYIRESKNIPINGIK